MTLTTVPKVCWQTCSPRGEGRALVCSTCQFLRHTRFHQCWWLKAPNTPPCSWHHNYTLGPVQPQFQRWCCSQGKVCEHREQFLIREPQLLVLWNGDNSTLSPNLLCWYESQEILAKESLSYKVLDEKRGKGWRERRSLLLFLNLVTLNPEPAYLWRPGKQAFLGCQV